MANNQNTGPKTVPLKKTSSIPLKKETVRVSVKADPAKPPQNTGATPPPLPTATSVKTVPLNEASIVQDPMNAKTVALDGAAPALPPKSAPAQGTLAAPSPKTAPLSAPSAKAPTPSAAPGLKTQPLSAPTPPSVPAPPKTAPLPNAGTTPPPPIPTASAGSSGAPSGLKTQPLSVPASGLKTQPLSAPSAPVAPATASAPFPTAPIGVGASTAPTMTRAIQQTKIIKSRWPIAIVALVLAMGVCGLTIWEYYTALGNSI